MKKEFKVIIAAFLAIWIFVMGIEVGVIKERKANSAAPDTTASVPVVTTEPTQPTEPTTTQPTTTQPTSVLTVPSTDALVPSSGADVSGGATDVNASVPANDTTSAQPAPSDDPASLSKEQVLEKVTSYMTKLKSEQNMTAKKSENITVQLTELSASALKSLVQGIIDNLAGAEEITYTFSGGQATDENGNPVTPNDVIPPTKKAFSLTAAGVASAKAEKVGDNTVYTLVLVEESTTLESPEPAHNSVAIGYLNLAGLPLPSAVKLTKADMHYPGSKVIVTVDAGDKVIALKNELPMTGKGEAEALRMSGSASFEGALNEEWTFTY